MTNVVKPGITTDHGKASSTSLRATRMIAKHLSVPLRALGGGADLSRLRASRLSHQIVGKNLSWKPKYDLCVVVPEKSRGWILEGVCVEIATHSKLNCVLGHDLNNLPRARSYFFSHYHFLMSALETHPFLWGVPKIGWFTHPKSENCITPATQFVFAHSMVLTMCSMWAEYLVDQNIPRNRIETLVAGADASLFKSHNRGSGKVGICCNYYNRKSPTRIVELVKSRPDTPFLLRGREWKGTMEYESLSGLKNFTYLEGDYHEYPSYYSQLDVIVSMSELEGGPIPILEGMMSNVVPVASRTGFAPDVIRHGQNGFLFDIDASIEVVNGLISQALSLSSDVRPTVLAYTWKNFVIGIERILEEMAIRDQRTIKKFVRGEEVDSRIGTFQSQTRKAAA